MERVKGIELAQRFPDALNITAAEQFMNLIFLSFQWPVVKSSFPFSSMAQIGVMSVVYIMSTK